MDRKRGINVPALEASVTDVFGCFVKRGSAWIFRTHGVHLVAGRSPHHLARSFPLAITVVASLCEAYRSHVWNERVKRLTETRLQKRWTLIIAHAPFHRTACGNVGQPPAQRSLLPTWQSSAENE